MEENICKWYTVDPWNQAFKLHGSTYMWAFSLNLHYSATQSGINWIRECGTRNGEGQQLSYTQIFYHTEDHWP